MTLRRLCWLFPDRESSRTAVKWDGAFWQTYREVAKECDLSWDRVTPESVTVDALDLDHPRVYVDGALVTPADTLFVTSLYSLPYQASDVFNQLALYAVLEQAGFYLPHPPGLATICNDKLATLLYLRDWPVPPIPTVRIGPGRDLVYDEYLRRHDRGPDLPGGGQAGGLVRLARASTWPATPTTCAGCSAWPRAATPPGVPAVPGPRTARLPGLHGRRRAAGRAAPQARRRRVYVGIRTRRHPGLRRPAGRAGAGAAVLRREGAGALPVRGLPARRRAVLAVEIELDGVIQLPRPQLRPDDVATQRT